MNNKALSVHDEIDAFNQRIFATANSELTDEDLLEMLISINIDLTGIIVQFCDGDEVPPRVSRLFNEGYDTALARAPSIATEIEHGEDCDSELEPGENIRNRISPFIRYIYFRSTLVSAALMHVGVWLKQ